MARKLRQMKYGSGLAALAGPHPRSALCKAPAVYLNVLCEHRPVSPPAAWSRGRDDGNPLEKSSHGEKISSRGLELENRTVEDCMQIPEPGWGLVSGLQQSTNLH